MPGSASRCGIVVQTSLVTLHCHNRNPSTGRNLWDLQKKCCHTVSVCALYTNNVYRRSVFKCTQTYELTAFEYIALITVAKMCTWYSVNVCMHWAGTYLCTTQHIRHCTGTYLLYNHKHYTQMLNHVHLLILCTALRPRCVLVALT